MFYVVFPCLCKLIIIVKPKNEHFLWGGVGATKREGGRQVKFYPYEKGGESGFFFSHAGEGLGGKCFGVVFADA